MNILLEIGDEVCIDKVSSRICDDLMRMLDEYEATGAENLLLSKIEAFCLCLQFCGDTKKWYNSINQQEFFCKIIKFYFEKNFFSLSVMHSLSNLMIHLINFSQGMLITHQKTFSDYLLCSLQECCLLEEDKSKWESYFKKVNVFLGFAASIPDTMVMDLLKNVTMAFCFCNMHHCSALQCLASLEILLIKIKPHTSSNLSAMIFDCFLKLLNTHIDWKNNVDIDILQYFDHLESNNLDEKVAVCNHVMNLIFKWTVDNEFYENENVSNILQSGLVWIFFLMGCYHNQTIVRKKTSSTLSCVVACIKKMNIFCSVSWNKSLQFANQLMKFNNTIISITSNNVHNSVSMLLLLVQICELLEENQTHVVFPAIAKIESFLKFTMISNDGNQLWIVPIFARMFFHEHK